MFGLVERAQLLHSQYLALMDEVNDFVGLLVALLLHLLLLVLYSAVLAILIGICELLLHLQNRLLIVLLLQMLLFELHKPHLGLLLLTLYFLFPRLLDL